MTDTLIILYVVVGAIVLFFILNEIDSKKKCLICDVRFSDYVRQKPHPHFSDCFVCENCSNKLLQISSSNVDKEKNKNELIKPEVNNVQKIDNLTIIDRAEIAKYVTRNFDYKKFKDIRDFLSEEKDIIEAFRVLHESQRNLYEQAIESKGMLKSHVSSLKWSNELEACMNMGEKYLIETSGYLKNQQAVEKPITDESKPINKEYSWKELKDREGLS